MALRLGDQRMLSDMVVMAGSGHPVAFLAKVVERLDAPAELARIATWRNLLYENEYKDNYSLRVAAVKKIDDPKTLADIAIRASYDPVPEAAVARLDNQESLARVARERKRVGSEGVRLAALAKITDQKSCPASCKATCKAKWTKTSGWLRRAG